MRRLRRFTALLLSVLLVQSSEEHWATCIDGAIPGATSDAMPVTKAENAAHVPIPAHVDHSAEAGCPIPTAPAACSAMTACGTPALPAAADLVAVQTPRREGGWDDPTLWHRTARPAPDLPPPRA